MFRRTVRGRGFGTTSWPVKNAIKKFRPEFEEYITTGKKTVKPAEQLMAAH